MLKRWGTQVREAVFLGKKFPLKPTPYRGLLSQFGHPKSAKTQDIFLQFTFIGRALPYGSDAVVNSAVAKHAEILCSKGESPEWIVSAAREFSANWARKYNFSVDFASTPVIKNSSCFQYSLRKGGYSRKLGEILSSRHPVAKSHSHAVPITGTSSNSSNLGPQIPTTMTTSFDEIYNQAKRGFQFDGGNKCQVHGLPERGYKCRVVTSHPAEATAFLHYFGTGLRRSLARDPHIRDVLSGDHHRAVEQLFDNYLDPRAEILSADLTSATDTFHADIVQAIFGGFLDSLVDVDVPIRELAFDLAVGAYALHYPKGSEMSTRVTQRGVLMGTPTSWPILCVLNLFWVSLAQDMKKPRGHCIGEDNVNIRLDEKDQFTVTQYDHISGRKSKHLVTDTRKSNRTNHVVCGDDLLLVARPSVCRRYEELARLCGAIFSPGKHLSSRTHGIFTENIFTVSMVVGSVSKAFVVATNDTPQGTWAWSVTRDLPLKAVSTVRKQVGIPVGVRFDRWTDCIPLRWAVKSESSDNHLPLWYNIGPSAESVVRAHPDSHEKVARILKLLHPGLPRWFYAVGIPPFLPRTLGGAGLVKSDPRTLKMKDVCSRFYQDGIHALIYRERMPRTLTRLYTTSVSPAYARALTSVEREMSRFRTRGTTIRPPNSHVSVNPIVSNYEDRIEEEASKSVLWSSVYYNGLTKEVPTVTGPRLATLLRKELSSVLKKRGGYKHSNPRSSVEKVLYAARHPKNPDLFWEERFERYRFVDYDFSWSRPRRYFLWKHFRGLGEFYSNCFENVCVDENLFGKRQFAVPERGAVDYRNLLETIPERE